MKPKVLHIDSETEWRGGQRQAAYLHEGLLKMNIESAFCARKNSKLADYFKNKNQHFYELPFKNEIDIYSAFKIAQIAKKNKFNILHCHSAHSLSIGILASYFYKVKVIASRRVDFRIKSNFSNKFKYRNSKLNRIVCISSYIQKVLLECGIPVDKTKVIKSGIDIHRFDKCESTLLKSKLNPENKIVIGTISAIENHKDYPTFIEAAKIILSKRNDVLFIALGSGSLMDEMKSKIAGLGLSENFKLVGFQNEIGEFLRMFDIFTLFSSKEGLGTSILDAMSVGLPIIGTNAGGIPEIVINEENGFLVPKKNPKALANAIFQLVENGDLRRKFGNNSTEFVKNFSVEKMIENNFNLYCEILEEKS